MSLNITATLQDPSGSPLLVDAQVVVFATKGEPKLIGAGRPDKAGKLLIASKFTVGELQPRVQLLLLRGDTFVEASEDPVTFTDLTCDFGVVKFNPIVLKDPRLPPAPSDDSEDARAALVKEMETQFSIDLAKALAAQSEQLAADKAAALTAQTQQFAADKAAALTAQSQQLAAERLAALASQAQQLAADKAAALAAQATQLAADKAAALVQRSQELTGEKTVALAAQAQQHAQVVAQKDAALAQKDAKITDLEKQLAAAMSDAPHESSIEDLAQTAADQIQRVQQTLRDDKAGLQLGKVSLQLKVLPGKTGGRISLPQAKEIEKVGAGALGSIDLAFLPDAGAVRPKPANLAPRLLGYTETLARRKLAERGLGVEVVHQLVTSAAEHGRVVLQRPPPKAPVADGTTVLIAIGRKDEHDPRPT